MMTTLLILGVIACAWVAYVRHLDKKEAQRRDREAMVRLAHLLCQEEAILRAVSRRNVVHMPPKDHPIWKRRTH